MDPVDGGRSSEPLKTLMALRGNKVLQSICTKLELSVLQLKLYFAGIVWNLPYEVFYLFIKKKYFFQ